MSKEKMKTLKVRLERLLKDEPVSNVEIYGDDIHVFINSRESYSILCKPLEQNPKVKVYCGRKVKMTRF